MGAQLALLICTIGVAGLFYLDRDRTARTSIALWLPVIWLWLTGSRPASVWLGVDTGSAGNLASTLDGSPLDAAIFEGLIFAGIIVLFLRRRKTVVLLKASVPVLLYFLYCMLSTLWSPIHGPAFKRWIKDVGDLAMVLIIVTDAHPITAIRQLYSRVGFILLPFSVALIRYTDLGRAYDPSGGPENIGVTTNKNTLGLVVFLVSIGAIWNLRSLLKNKKAPNRTRHLVAQGTLLVFGIVLLQMAHCATAVACFVLGGGLMLAAGLKAIRSRPARIHALCLGVLLSGAVILLFGGESMVTGALGRESNLTGRTDIWKASLAAADNPIIGTGFESFWNVNVDKVALGLRGYWKITNLVSAHNGYIEVYLDLGLVGVCLIALILITGYRHACDAFKRNPNLGSLLLAYIVSSAFYSITEVGFRALAPSWIFLLLAVVCANGVRVGIVGGKAPGLVSSSRGRPGLRTPVSIGQIPEKQTIIAARRGLTHFGVTRANFLG